MCRFADTAIGRILIPTDEHSPFPTTIENMLVMIWFSDAFDHFVELWGIPVMLKVLVSGTDLEGRTFWVQSSATFQWTSSPLKAYPSFPNCFCLVKQTCQTTTDYSTTRLRTCGTACGCWTDRWSSAPRARSRWISQSWRGVYLSRFRRMGNLHWPMVTTSPSFTAKQGEQWAGMLRCLFS